MKNNLENTIYATKSNDLNRDDKFELLKKDTAGFSRNFKPSNRRIEIQVSQGDSEEMKSNWLSTDILFLVGVLLYDIVRIVVGNLSEDPVLNTLKECL